MLPKKNNNFLFGLALGTLIPIAAYFVFNFILVSLENAGYASTAGFSPMFRERTTAIVAIGLNAVLMNYFHKRYMSNAQRGVVLPTFIFILGWLWFFKDIVFRNSDFLGFLF